MTRLRKMMLEELQRLNYAETTIRHYIRTVEDFARRFNCPPDRLGPPYWRVGTMLASTRSVLWNSHGP
jgi:hypothetical protein